ncbi:hypothetical protein [Streptomyces prasinus]|uniref:hypothetical protein n=1 Tax=Streptomyces prasinus TaxID=67345 RepID=UPI0036904E25
MADEERITHGLDRSWVRLSKDGRIKIRNQKIRPLLEREAVLFHLDNQHLRSAVTGGRLGRVSTSGAGSVLLASELLRFLQVFGALGVVAGAGAPDGHDDSESLVPSPHHGGHWLLADRADKRSLGTGLAFCFTHSLILGFSDE